MSKTFNMSGGGGGIKLAAIAILTPPDQTAYRPGQTFDPAGMVVQAIYENGATVTATGWTYTPSGALTEGTQNVTILYTEGGVTVQIQQTVTVQKASIPVPAQSGTLTYNGGPQVPAWSGYDTAEMSLGGVTSGTNAGSYNAVFTLRDTVGTQWPDGTTTPKTVAWKIQKAVGSLSISPETMTLDTGTPSKVITVTRSGTGAITAQSSTPEVASVSVSGNQVTVTGLASGSSVITISAAEDDNYTAPEVKNCSVQVNFIPAKFSDATWEQVISVCQSGEVPDTWVVGDYKNMTINGTTYRIDIIGKNHDTYASGGTAPLTFQMHDCYNRSHMNSSETNEGGWSSCAMRNTNLPSILNRMPANVRTAIREVKKRTSAGQLDSSIQTTNDKLFLLSEIEIFGSTAYSYAREGSQYAWYQAGNSRVKNVDGVVNSWWERSPGATSGRDFCNVSSSGDKDYLDADRNIGVTFAFCF